MKIYFIASKLNTWEDGYNENFPYSIEVEFVEDTVGEYSWTVGSIDLEIPEQTFTVDHIINCQVQGLEQVLKEHKARAYKRTVRLEEQLANLLALPNLEAANEDV